VKEGNRGIVRSGHRVGSPYRETRRADTSDAESLAALGAAAGQHESAALGSHPCTKAVCAFAMQVAGLVSALHGECPICPAQAVSRKQDLTEAAFQGAARVRTASGSVKPTRRRIESTHEEKSVSPVDNLYEVGIDCPSFRAPPHLDRADLR
jgi:hypothetical protein